MSKPNYFSIPERPDMHGTLYVRGVIAVSDIFNIYDAVTQQMSEVEPDNKVWGLLHVSMLDIERQIKYEVLRQLYRYQAVELSIDVHHWRALQLALVEHEQGLPPTGERQKYERTAKAIQKILDGHVEAVTDRPYQLRLTADELRALTVSVDLSLANEPAIGDEREPLKAIYKRLNDIELLEEDDKDA